KALAPLANCVEMTEAVEAVAEAAFELLPRATHVSVLLRNDVHKDRFTVALARERGANGRATSQGDGAGAPVDPVRASRAVLRRVLDERAAVITANAQEELGTSDSIVAGSILSMLSVPLWLNEEITGLIQADNRRSAGIFSERDLE